MVVEKEGEKKEREAARTVLCRSRTPCHRRRSPAPARSGLFVKCAQDVIHRGALPKRSGQGRGPSCASRSTSPPTRRGDNIAEPPRRVQTLPSCAKRDGPRLIVAQTSRRKRTADGPTPHCAQPRRRFPPRGLHDPLAPPQNVISGESQEGQRDYCGI